MDLPTALFVDLPQATLYEFLCRCFTRLDVGDDAQLLGGDASVGEVLGGVAQPGHVQPERLVGEQADLPV
ncbi:hypothetical protein EAO76_09870 [Streptomyces sp. sk2.1]|nr:hypothetical protein EAO76_09870 [Streptomyces sp. sk2.1]